MLTRINPYRNTDFQEEIWQQHLGNLEAQGIPSGEFAQSFERSRREFEFGSVDLRGFYLVTFYSGVKGTGNEVACPRPHEFDRLAGEVRPYVIESIRDFVKALEGYVIPEAEMLRYMHRLSWEIDPVIPYQGAICSPALECATRVGECRTNAEYADTMTRFAAAAAFSFPGIYRPVFDIWVGDFPGWVAMLQRRFLSHVVFQEVL